jgi:hypothetical protein
VHDPGAGEGKTALMGKGLFLCVRERVCAGGSAGFGAPVFRTGLKTFFPSLVSLNRTGERSGEMVFALDRALFWYAGGKKAPACLTRISELLVEVFMRHTAIQAPLLKIHDRILSFCAAEGRILPVLGAGFCRMGFHLCGQDIHFCMRGSFKTTGRLIALNEADGELFDLLRTRAGMRRDSSIPAWEEADFDAELRSSRLGLGLSLSPEGPDTRNYRLYCGREVGRGLNWAGFALAHEQPYLSYRIGIHPL